MTAEVKESGGYWADGDPLWWCTLFHQAERRWLMTSRMALEGLRVLDVSTILAGPLCCQILGDHGADVIKIEHPRAGDSMRGHGPSKDGVPLWWKEISRNKRTVALDLKS